MSDRPPRAPDQTPPARRINVDAATPVFLERASYRQRRLRDALRMLPVLGAILWALPLVRAAPDEARLGNAGVLAYVFGVWAGLIGLSWLVSRRLRLDMSAESGGEKGSDEKASDAGDKGGVG